MKAGERSLGELGLLSVSRDAFSEVAKLLPDDFERSDYQAECENHDHGITTRADREAGNLVSKENECHGEVHNQRDIAEQLESHFGKGSAGGYGSGGECQLEKQADSVSSLASQGGREEAGRAAGCAAGGGAPAPAGLPCHTADKCIKRGNGYSRTAKDIRATMGSFVARWGVERLAFMTHTFAGEAPTIKEARRRWRSLRTNALDGRYLSWMCVLQRGRFGRLHFHLVVVCREDVRTGFDFEAVKQRDYHSASEYLRGEWAFWREACPKYNFGRCELLPVRTDAERAARYVARYISRHLRARYPQDKRARLVSFADNAREGLARHRLHVETGGPAERRLGGLIHDLGLSGIGELRAGLGRSWRRKLARLLDSGEITERDFWRIVHESKYHRESGLALDEALQESIAAVTSEPTEWQAEF